MAVAAALVDARATPEALEVDVRLHSAGRIATLTADRVVNCTGPTTAFARIGDPLVRSILAKGLAMPDRLGLGLEVTSGSVVVAASGAPRDTLFATGPLTRRAFLEMFAAPELRRQAPETALRLLAALTPRTSPQPRAI